MNIDFIDIPTRVPRRTWCGKCVAMQHLDKQTHSITNTTAACPAICCTFLCSNKIKYYQRYSIKQVLLLQTSSEIVLNFNPNSGTVGSELDILILWLLSLKDSQTNTKSRNSHKKPPHLFFAQKWSCFSFFLPA